MDIYKIIRVRSKQTYKKNKSLLDIQLNGLSTCFDCKKSGSTTELHGYPINLVNEHPVLGIHSTSQKIKVQLLI